MLGIASPAVFGLGMVAELNDRSRAPLFQLRDLVITSNFLAAWQIPDIRDSYLSGQKRWARWSSFCQQTCIMYEKLSAINFIVLDFYMMKI